MILNISGKLLFQLVLEVSICLARLGHLRWRRALVCLIYFVTPKDAFKALFGINTFLKSLQVEVVIMWTQIHLLGPVALQDAQGFQVPTKLQDFEHILMHLEGVKNHKVAQ